MFELKIIPQAALPQNGNFQPSVSVSGYVLTVDGVDLDFGPISDGDELPAEAVDCPWIARDSVQEVTRVNGRVTLNIICPIGPNAPEESRFPEPIFVDNDGPVTLPPFGETPAEQES